MKKTVITISKINLITYQLIIFQAIRNCPFKIAFKPFFLVREDGHKLCEFVCVFFMAVYLQKSIQCGVVFSYIILLNLIKNRILPQIQ